MQSTLTRKQGNTKTKFYTEDGEQFRITVKLRYDDECGNGHNTFAMTADIDRKGGNGRWYDYSGGCCHEEIVKRFPDLAKYVKWHLTSSDGPMYYLENTLYHAGRRDCHGLMKGEIRGYAQCVKFDGFPFTFEAGHRLSKEFFVWLNTIRGAHITKPEGVFDIVEMPHDREPQTYGSKFTFAGFPVEGWYKCPFDDRKEAEQWREALLNLGFEILMTPNSWGEGKEPDFDGARSCGVWPEATDAELDIPREELKAKLLARLPALMAEFKHDMEELGFTF